MTPRHLIPLAVAAALVMPAAALASPPQLKKPADAKKDRDRDGMPDAWEKANGLDPRRDDAKADRDRDGLANLGEYRAGTNPRRADSDGDGMSDRDEIRHGRNPRKSEPAESRMTVTAFDPVTGALTVTAGSKAVKAGPKTATAGSKAATAGSKAVTITVTVTADTELSWHHRSAACPDPATTADLTVGRGVHEIETEHGGTVADEVSLEC